MIKRSHIRQFLALVEAESFTQAASRIHITQPTLSVGIADLEELVGAKLFHRERRRARLTNAGRRFLPIAQELDGLFRKADRFSQKPGDRWPELRIGMIRSLSGATVEKLLARICSSFAIELIEGSDAELRSLMTKDHLDAIITVLRDGDSPERSHTLFAEPYVMFMPDGHTLASSEAVAPEQLAGEVMIARRSCEILGDTSKFFTRHGVRPRFAFKSDSDERCMRMVAAGGGITTAPLSLQLPGTMPVSVTGYDFSRRIGVLLPPNPAPDFQLADVRDLLPQDLA